MARLSQPTKPKTTAHLTAHIPLDLHTAIAVEAAQRRIRKSDVVIEALTKYLVSRGKAA